MIAALLAAPMVQGVVGQVMHAFAPTPQPVPVAFNPYLDRASTAVKAPSSISSTGMMRADQWNEMSDSDVQSWVKGLTGKHVDATDESGRTITGQVNGMQMLGSTLAINIGGHLVSLSQLKQISWSPSAV